MKLAIFDCDGTLVDSQANIIAAMEATFAGIGLPPPPAVTVRRVVGLSLAEAMAQLLPDADDATHHRLAEDYKQAFRQLRHQHRLAPEPLYHGIAGLLDQLDAEGWLLAIATGKSDRGLAMTLDHHQLHGRFISLQTADRHPSKPHPSMLLACLADAGLEPQQAAIIGDTVFDVEMGRAAGVRAIGVDWGYHDPADLLAAGAVGVATSTTHLKDLLNGR